MTHDFFDFHERFNEWVREDKPSDDRKFWVMAWLFALQDNPRVSAAPASELGEAWWFARVPHAEDARTAVVCLYSINGTIVRCSGITTLSKPI